MRPIRRAPLRVLALIGVSALLALAVAGERAESAADTIRVPFDYPTIQAAIDAAQDGDVVLVSPGTYRERLSIRGKGITLASEFLTTGDQSAIDTTVLEPPAGPEALTILSPAAASSTKIVGFTIVNVSGAEIDGVKAFSRAEILNNHLVGLVDGLDLEPSHTGPATPYVVRDNVIENSVDDAVDLDGPTTALVEGNALRDSREDGIEVRLHEHAGRLEIVIRGNTITGSRQDGIQLIDVGASSDRLFTIERNIISATRAGLGLMDNSDSTEDYRAASITDEIRLFNNTFVGNNHAVSGGDNLVAVNNLFVNSSTLGLKGVDANSVAAHNLFWGNGANAAGSNVDAATTITADPLLGPDYALLEGSPAIDAGATSFTWQGSTVLNLPAGSYAGDGPDLGARERVTPETTITDGPPGSSSATAASFEFASSVVDSTFECALDGAAYESCTSPATYGGLGDGPHAFEVRAIDPAGTADPTPARFTWTVDTISPETTITSGPSNPSDSASASFAFASSDPDSTFECALDGASYETCSSPKAYSGLAEGRHTFQVRATDAVGNVDSSPASSTWTLAIPVTVTLAPAADARVEQTQPGTNYGSSTSLGADLSPYRESYLRFNVSGLTRTVRSAKLRVFDFNGTADGPALYSTDASWSETAITWNVKPPRIGGVIEDKGANPTSAWVEYDVGSVVRGNGAYSFNLVPTSSDGADYNSREASQRRPELVLTLGADLTEPETTIVSGPVGSVGSASANVAFSSSEPGSTFECALDAGAFTACSSPQSYSGLAEGAHAFQVRATDSAGNTDPTPATRMWTVDTTPPATSIDGGPSGVVATASATFTFSADDSDAGFDCALDGGAFTACSSPQSYSGVADGAHAFQVRATDGAGNTDPTSATRMWTVDTTPPATSIDSGPSGVVATGSATFTFSSDQADAGFECSLDGGAFAACSSPQSYAGLADGSHTLRVRAADGVGNTDPTPATRTWNVDTTPPATSIVSGPSGVVATGSADFTFSSDEPGSSFECALDGAVYASCGSPQSYAGLAEGSHTFRVRATDGVGNTDPTPATWTWTVHMSTVVTLTAEADARVEQRSPSSNYGSSSTLVSDLSPMTETYLRFTVTGVTGTIKSAKLRLWVTSESDDGPALYAAGNSWTESGISWNKKPARTGGIIDNRGSVGSDRWVEYSVLALVRANGTYTFNLVPESDDGLAVRSREASSNEPQLVLEVDQG